MQKKKLKAQKKKQQEERHLKADKALAQRMLANVAPIKASFENSLHVRIMKPGCQQLVPDIMVKESQTMLLELTQAAKLYQQIANNDIRSHKEVQRKLKQEAGNIGDLNGYRKTAQQLIHMLNYAEEHLDDKPLLDTEGGPKKKSKVKKS